MTNHVNEEYLALPKINEWGEKTMVKLPKKLEYIFKLMCMGVPLKSSSRHVKSVTPIRQKQVI